MDKAVLEYEQFASTVGITNAIEQGNVVVQRGSTMPPNYLDEELIQEELADTEVDITQLQEVTGQLTEQELDEVLNESFTAVGEDSGIVLMEGTPEFEEALSNVEFAEQSTVVEGDLLNLSQFENVELNEVAENALGGIEDIELITYADEAASAAEALSLAEIASSAAVAAEAVGPLALLVLATYGINYSLKQLQKEAKLEEEMEKRRAFVKRRDASHKMADAQPTVGKKNEVLNAFYRQPETYLLNPETNKWYDATESIKSLDKFISGYNKHINIINKSHDLYNKWVINKNNPDVREHPFKPMPPLELNRVIRSSPGLPLHKRVGKFIKDNYNLENTSLTVIDPLMLDHMREQVYADPQYRQALVNAFNSGKYNVRNVDELETTLKPPFWSTYYTINHIKYLKQDNQAIKNSIKAYNKRGGRPIKDVRTHKTTPQERFDRMFQSGMMPGLRHINHMTGEVHSEHQDRPATIKHKDGRKPVPITYHKTKIPPTPLKHDVEKKINNIHLHPSKEWALEQRGEEYDPNLSLHYNNLSNLTFDYKTKYSTYDDMPINKLMSKYNVKQDLGDRDGFMLYDAKDDIITVAIAGTDYPGTKHGIYKKFVKDIFQATRSNLMEIHGDHIHAGFLDKYKQLAPAINKFITTHIDKNTYIVFTGFSSGGAIAQIAAYRLAKNLRTKNIGVYAFGSPRVFSRDTALNVNKLVPNIYRINLHNDLVPYFPLKNVGDGGYYHAGTEILYDDAGRFRRYGGDIDIDNSYTLKDILKKLVISWKTHSRENYYNVLDKHLTAYNAIGTGIKREDEMLSGYGNLFSDNDTYTKINNNIYKSNNVDIMYYPSYHRGQIYMTAIPKHYIMGLYFYKAKEFSNTTGNIKGFVVY